MFAAMKVLGRMFVLGGIAAPHMPAFEAEPQMDPVISGFNAIFTDMRLCAGVGDLVEMSTLSQEVLPRCFVLMLRAAQTATSRLPGYQAEQRGLLLCPCPSLVKRSSR